MANGKRALFLPSILSAETEELVDEKQINKWGYTTIESRFSNRESYVAELQTIKSIKQAPELENHYYSYIISQEYYSSKWEAIKRKMSLLYTGEKNYTLSELHGKCVRIITTAVKFATFKEQSRVFSLFNKYLEKY